MSLLYLKPSCFLSVGLCPDWEDWDPKKAKANAKEAMDAAEQWLDVPQVGCCYRNQTRSRLHKVAECFVWKLITVLKDFMMEVTRQCQ